MAETVASSQPQGSLGHTIFKNTLFATLGSFALKALNFLFSVYIVRRLGDDRFGQYSVVLAFVGLFQIFAELGISQYIMREIAQDRAKTQQLFWNMVVLRLLLALAGIVGITLAAVAFGYSPELVLGILIYTATFILAALQAPLQTVLMAHERFDYATAMTILGQLAFVILGTIFLLSGLGYLWLIVASLISIIPQIALGLWAVQRHRLLAFSPQIHPRTWPRLIWSGIPFGIISLTLTITFSLDTILLKMFQPDYVVGWYRVAYNLIFSIMFLTYGFKDAIVPSLSRTYVSDPTQVERWYYRTVKAMLMLSLPIAVGGTLVAHPLIRFLYTDAFAPSAVALQILIWDVPFLMFTSFCGNITTIVKEERTAAIIYTITAAANIVLNLILIPRYGYLGASVVTVLTDLIGAMQFHFLLRRKLKPPDLVSVSARILLAAALMGLAIGLVNLLANQPNLFLLIGLGVAVYGALVLALRLLDESEWALIRRVLRAVRGSQPAGETSG